MKLFRKVFSTILFACLSIQIHLAQADEAPPKDPKGGTTQEALDEAKALFLEAMEALNRAGKRAYEDNAPEVGKKARDMLDESKRLLDQWMDRVRKEMDRESSTPKAPPSAPSGDQDRSFI
ncbi:MAG: hypothetical protein HQL76_04870 [Magnetococcales bacterium]|nr:hypothetical protein [Magnetococcales bacterium]